MSNNQAVLTQNIVVTQVYQVINLSSFANDGAICSSTVNTGIIANFYIIMQDNVASLQNFAVLTILSNVTKAIATNNSTSLQDNSVT